MNEKMICKVFLLIEDSSLKEVEQFIPRIQLLFSQRQGNPLLEDDTFLSKDL